MFKYKGQKALKKLARGANNEVYALDAQTVGKLFDLGSKSLQDEVARLEFANKVNDVLVKFKNVSPTDDYEFDLLIMERLYPLERRAIELGVKEAFFEAFSANLKELHAAGFAHGDLKRTSDIGSTWDNIILTRSGIRLIDTGLSRLKTDSDFESVRKQDLVDVKDFKPWFLEY